MDFNEQQDYIKSRLRTITKDPWLIDELTQTINIKIFSCSPRVESESSYKTWMNKTIKNTFIDYYRKTNTKKEKIFSTSEEDGISDFNPDEKLIKMEEDSDREKLYTKLASFIDKLPTSQKETLILRYYFNCSLKKVSKILKCPYNTVLGYSHNAKHNLRKMFNQYA